MKHLKRIIYRAIDRHFLEGCTSYNPLEVRRSCRSKEQARAVFAANGIPHARGAIFFNPWKAHRFARDHGFPLVVKPNVSGFSRGSHFPIDNSRELWKAALAVKIWWPVSVVEQYLAGRNYRVLVGNGRIISIIRRYPPFVVGDGASTIEQLIDAENATREAMGLYPVIHPIPRDRRIRRYLARQGMNLKQVPADGEVVNLFNRIALAPGGVVETIPLETVPEVNRRLFLRILELFDANILGIDVIMAEGIEHSFEEQRCIFLEVNSRPYVAMHRFPRFGKRENLEEHFRQLDALQVENADLF